MVYRSTIKTIHTLFPLLFFSLWGCSGCSTVSYLFQAGQGQLAIMNRARPIPEVIQDETTPTRTRDLLKEVAKVKAFGEKMGLKPTKNYQDYVKLDRDAVVYVVSACDPLKFEPKEWKFPIVGGFPYIGWYARDDADRYAATLRKEGFDVDVRGAPAYSTLGWFRDPILSTMIPAGPYPAPDLIEVILHESLHATAYVNHQAFFNESAASWVSEKLTPLYLSETRGPASADEKAYAESLAWQDRYMQKMHEGYVLLEKIYASGATVEEKLTKKAAVIADLKRELKWKEGRDLNNATLLGFREYNGNRDVFDRIFEKCGKDWGRFLNALKSFSEKEFDQPQSKEISNLVVRAGC